MTRHKKFSRRERQNEQEKSAFDGLSHEEIETHIAIRKYGNFTLTRAITPSYDLKIKPVTGFKREYLIDGCISMPIIIISASKEILFDLFIELTDLFGKKTVDVVLETSHHHSYKNYTDMLAERVQMLVLKSALWDFQDLLLDDGCMGISIIKAVYSMELFFDNHKLLFFYNWPVARRKLFSILKKYGIQERRRMQLISDQEHIHSSSRDFKKKFSQLSRLLGAEAE